MPGIKRWFANLLTSLAFTAGTLVFALGVPTLVNLYHGELNATPHTRVGGRAYVQGCQRFGPVSRYGFGYWWQCQVDVSLDDGRIQYARVGRSIVTPADEGRPVRVVEDCDDPGYKDCAYSRPGNAAVALAIRAIVLVTRIITFFALFGSFLFLGLSLLGRRLSSRMFGMRVNLKEAAQFADYPDRVAPVAGSGVISVRMIPSGYAAATYGEVPSCRLVIDGVQRPVTGWGVNSAAFAPGRHTVSANVVRDNLHLPDVEHDVVVADGAETLVVYREGPGVSGEIRVVGERETSMGRAYAVFGLLLLAGYLLWRLFG